jgi:hypothetical protein
LPPPARRRTALLGAGLVGLAVTVLASLAVLRLDDPPAREVLPPVGRPPDLSAIQKTVDARRQGLRLVVEYRTATPVDDCAAQAVEVPKVWALVIDPLVDAAPTRTVVIWVGNLYAPPVNGATARWGGMTFARDPGGAWAALEPCRIRIP